jgi:hypothetical protein
MPEINIRGGVTLMRLSPRNSLSRGVAEHSQQLKKAITHSERLNHVDVTVRLLIHITRRVINFEQTATAKQRTRGIGTGTGACRCR